MLHAVQPDAQASTRCDWHCVVGLQILNSLLRGKWPDAVAIELAILAFPLILAIAFAVRPGARVESGSQNPIDTGTEDPATPRAQVRNRMIIWLVIVITLLLMFKALDAFHVPWRQSVR
jgi:hypothetical protein